MRAKSINQLTMHIPQPRVLSPSFAEEFKKLQLTKKCFLLPKPSKNLQIGQAGNLK